MCTRARVLESAGGKGAPIQAIWQSQEPFLVEHFYSQSNRALPPRGGKCPVSAQQLPARQNSYSVDSGNRSRVIRRTPTSVPFLGVYLVSVREFSLHARVFHQNTHVVGEMSRSNHAGDQKNKSTIQTNRSTRGSLKVTSVPLMHRHAPLLVVPLDHLIPVLEKLQKEQQEQQHKTVTGRGVRKRLSKTRKQRPQG